MLEAPQQLSKRAKLKHGFGLLGALIIGIIFGGVFLNEVSHRLPLITGDYTKEAQYRSVEGYVHSAEKKCQYRPRAGRVGKRRPCEPGDPSWRTTDYMNIAILNPPKIERFVAAANPIVLNQVMDAFREHRKARYKVEYLEQWHEFSKAPIPNGDYQLIGLYRIDSDGKPVMLISPARIASQGWVLMALAGSLSVLMLILAPYGLYQLSRSRIPKHLQQQ